MNLRTSEITRLPSASGTRQAVWKGFPSSITPNHASKTACDATHPWPGKKEAMVKLFGLSSVFAMSRRSWHLAASASASLIALAASQPAQAVLNYYIVEDGGNVVVETQGSLNLPSPSSIYYMDCGTSLGALWGLQGVVCTGPTANIPAYPITGPTALSAGPASYTTGTSTSGKQTVLFGGAGLFTINSYLSGDPIIASTTFNGRTLASMGFTSLGTIGSWTINGTGDTINVIVGKPVPGPLPLLGAGTALGFSRRLRRRMALTPASGKG